MQNSEQFARVVAEKLLTYALGRGVEDQDMPLVRSIVRDAAGSNYRFSTLVLAIVKSPPFQNNVKGAETSQSAKEQKTARVNSHLPGSNSQARSFGSWELDRGR
jgi:hypothetical protein